MNGVQLERFLNKIINNGDKSGNEMVVKFQLPSGLEIFGLPTENYYGGHWDLGPTWNYVVMADKPFLVDAGRFGQGKRLVDMMVTAGIEPDDLGFVIISHSHEDHDGGLAALVKSTDLKVKAHRIYDLLIRKYPGQAPSEEKDDFPAKCWHCAMPESFYTQNCLEYHRVLQDLKVDPIGDGKNELGPDIQTVHLPGHSPDCLAILLNSEAIIVGDIVLPDISPRPTQEALYDEVADVIKPFYGESEAVFGLERYIKSLKKLDEIARRCPEIFVLPGHRFFYNGQWNWFRLSDKVNELIQHHIQRCAAIIEILQNGPMKAEEIAQEHFPKNLLEGYGSMMAENEILSHCELLMKNGDLTADNDNRYVATGKNNFENSIGHLDMRDIGSETT
jgi:glyoxylase-like metal-dependent hydrolase (beta-lactamase superfamily II)